MIELLVVLAGLFVGIAGVEHRRLRRERDYWWASYMHATRECWGPLARRECGSAEADD